jgi:type II secretory pathway pseudopilin PulG
MNFSAPLQNGGERARLGRCRTRPRVRRSGHTNQRAGGGFCGSHAVFRAGAENSARGGRAPGLRAFSLLEVMIAIAIFFTAAFAILSVVATSVKNAQYLRRPQVDAAAIASVFSTTNSITEGTTSGDLGDMLGDDYRGYTWESTAVEVASNKLFEVDYSIYSPAPGHPLYSQICTRFFRPQSPAGSLDGGMGIH